MNVSVANHRLFLSNLPTAIEAPRLLSEWNSISSWVASMKFRLHGCNEFPRGWKDVDREFYCSCRWRNRSQLFIFPDWGLGLGFGDGGSVFVKKEMKNEGFICTRARNLIFFSVAVIATRRICNLRSASARSWEKPTCSFTMRAKVWLPLLPPICCFLSVSLLVSSSVWKIWDRVPRGRRVFEVCVWCVWFDKIYLRFLLSLCGSVFLFCIWVAFSA